MNRILVWTETDVGGLADAWGLSRILTEIDEQGSVTRELGFDVVGKLCHRHPGKPTLASQGLFDGATISAGHRTEVEPEQFEQAWSA